jgi:ketosteroid isomerase-like protein
MRIDRVMSAGPGVVVAELTEVVEVAGKPLATAEALVFDMALDGRIARIAVYTQNEPAG